MTPAARLQAAIELLDAIEAGDRPADRVMSGWFRKRRYIGAKDRRAVGERVYAILRARAALDWQLERVGATAGPGVADGRARLLAALVVLEGAGAEAAAAAFDGSRYGPPPLDQDERALAEALAAAGDLEAAPAWVRGNYPAWLEPSLSRAFGAALADEMAALNREAPTDLRVNTLKADRDEAQAALAADGVTARPTPYSPLGLRLEGRANLAALAAFREGFIEVQDEGAQLAALLVGARPGEAVCDLCAGAGGKSLALAAAMADQGRILACDVDAARLRPMAGRLARAGVGIVETRVIAADAADLLADSEAAFDRVLVDAPCSGSGRWRRNPEAKWRFDAEALAGWCAVQARTLEAAARLVRPGGRVIYVTCSLLPEENDVQIAGLLAGHPDISPRPLPEIWAEVVARPAPEAGPYLLLTPARQGCDGTFVAVLERAA